MKNKNRQAITDFVYMVEIAKIIDVYKVHFKDVLRGIETLVELILKHDDNPRMKALFDYIYEQQTPSVSTEKDNQS